MKIVVLGAGAWGTALAVSAADNPLAQHAVTLWARDVDQMKGMLAHGENTRYLPGINLPSTLALSSVFLDQWDGLTGGADLLIVATPMAGLRSIDRKSVV